MPEPAESGETAPMDYAQALWRLRLQHYLQLARSGAGSGRLAAAAAAVHAAARDALALRAAEAPAQNQE